MNKSLAKQLFAVLVLGIVASGLWLLTRPIAPQLAPKHLVPLVSRPPELATQPAPVEPAPTPVSIAAPVEEVAATARMYESHAPLRLPEIADPDSKSNRKIIDAMVAKALSRSVSASSNR